MTRYLFEFTYRGGRKSYDLVDEETAVFMAAPGRFWRLLFWLAGLRGWRLISLPVREGTVPV